jgi:5-methylcytosine-specific restriction endonuclease McrA
MPRCKSCGATDSTTEWGRYARNGRLKVLCPACDGEYQTRRQRTEAAKAEGYLCWGNTLEYKRMQREAQAAKEGRVLPPYVPQSERNFRGRMRRAEEIADQIRARWAAEWLRPFRIERGRYQNDPEFREWAKAKSRQHYWAHLAKNRQKTVEYKRTHQDRVMAHHVRRAERIAETSDGTITVRLTRALKRKASRCAYCDAAMFASDKVTDHMIPLCRGGEHSVRNLVICCRICNGRKASLTYEEWVDRIEPEHRARVIALYELRYGMPLKAIAKRKRY